MKKNIIIYLSVLALFSYACGDTKKEPEASQSTETNTPAADTIAPPVATKRNGITQEDYEKGLALVVKSDCLSCHKVSEKLVGPSYLDVAKRYTAHPDTLDMLANKILKGGSGNWGAIPMTPHPTVSKEDAVQMVKYVLAIEEK